MKLKKTWNEARTVYFIDRTLNSGEVTKGFYSHIFDSEEKAQAFIDERNPTYRGKLSIRAEVWPAGYSYDSTIKLVD
jgi:hypothetical protein